MSVMDNKVSTSSTSSWELYTTLVITYSPETLQKKVIKTEDRSDGSCQKEVEDTTQSDIYMDTCNMFGVLNFNGGMNYECEYCYKRFRSRSILNRHKSLHTGVRPWKCELCGKLFRLKGNLNEHRHIHDSHKQFQCDKCGKSFALKHYLLRHVVRKHTTELPYKCETCLKSFGFNCDLQKHRRTHGEKSRKCEISHKRFSFRCGLCRKPFASKRYLQQHILRTHPAVMPFHCTDCGTSFAMKTDLKTHRSGNCIHAKEKKPFQKLTCKKSTRLSKGNSKGHSLTPTLKKPLKFGVSKESEGNLRDKRPKRMTKNSFRCATCRQSFIYKSSLTKHIQEHTIAKNIINRGWVKQE